jgi:4-amino-4-deoxy-L-arabinose transferase-like glycosyltransferase
MFRIPPRVAPWLALAFAAVLRWPLFLRPLQDLDEPNFASIAALCNAGGPLYGDGGVDNKPPGIFWAYQLAFAFGGRFAMAAVHLLCILVVLATAFVLGRVARRLGGERAGVYTALLYGVFAMANDPRMMAANTENFMMLPLAGAVWLLARDERPTLGRLAGAGALVAAACLFKQVAVVSLGVVCLALVAPLLAPDARPERGRRLVQAVAGALACVVGFAAVYALVAAVLAAQHTLGDALHWTVTSLFSHYGPSAWSGSLAGRLGDALASVALFALTALPLSVAALLGLRVPGERGVGQWLILAWLPLSALGVAAGGHFSDHYFIQLLGPLALLGGQHIARRPAEARLWTGAIALFAIGLMTSAALLDPITFQPFWRQPRPDYRALARAIDARTQPTERIFVWGNAPAIYVLSDRLPATRFVGFLRGLRRSEGESPDASWDAGPEVWPLLTADFARHPPALIVDTSTGLYREFSAYPMARFPALQALVTAGYVVDAKVEGATLYRRR